MAKVVEHDGGWIIQRIKARIPASKPFTGSLQQQSLPFRDIPEFWTGEDWASTSGVAMKCATKEDADRVAAELNAVVGA